MKTRQKGTHRSPATEFKKGQVSLRLGQKVSEETKLKISLANKGKHYSPNTEFKKGMIGTNLGKKASYELKKKLSEAHIGQISNRKGKTLEEEYGIERANEIRVKSSKAHTGKYLDKAPNWQGGLTFQKYPWEFNDKLKKRIRYRDKRCRICGKKERLFVHHIDYNKKNVDDFNLISLCRICHLKTNGKRLFWEQLLTLLLKEGFGG
jgi:hypothetical protein